MERGEWARAGRSGRGARDTSASPEGAKEAPPQEGVACQFCDLVSPDFADDEAMDAHYVNDCPMLMECPGCAQILDIQTLNEHLLTECELKQEFASCLNCGEAFHNSELDTRQTCGSNCVTMKKPNFAGRCPLCHCDIGLEMKASRITCSLTWAAHRTRESCRDEGPVPASRKCVYLSRTFEMSDEHQSPRPPH